MTIETFIRSPDNHVNSAAHSHPEYEFLIPITEIPFLTNEDVLYFGDAGYVFPVKSGYFHGVKYSLSDISFDSIVIDKAYFEALSEKAGGGLAAFTYEFRASEELLFYLSCFKNECERADMRDSGKLDCLCELICRVLIEACTMPELDNRRGKPLYGKGMRAAVEYINRNYSRRITLSELAQLCCLSENYLTASFKKMYGYTPMEYLKKLRISKARLLLSDSDFSIADIASKCGFSRQSSFTEAFKSSTGSTPGEYRKNFNSLFAGSPVKK